MKNKELILPAAIAIIIMVVVVGLLTIVAVTIQHAETYVSGPFTGLLDGLLILPLFLVSLFDSHICIYELANSGWTYNLGYLLGIGLLGVLVYFGGYIYRGLMILVYLLVTLLSLTFSGELSEINY